MEKRRCGEAEEAKVSAVERRDRGLEENRMVKEGGRGGKKNECLM